MIKKKINEKNFLASRWVGAKCMRPVMPFTKTQRMYTDLNVTMRIKEESP